MNINSNQFFDLLGEADSSYLEAAHKSMTAKPARAWFRPALIAACLTLVLIAIPVGIIIGNRTIKPSVPVITPTTIQSTITTTAAPPVTQTPPQTTAKTKPSILDIPGAMLFDENDERFFKLGEGYFGTHSISEEERLEWANQMKENNSIVIGYIKDSTSVLVEDGDGYYRINTMQIQVLKNIIDIEEKTITAVYACRYERNYGNVYKPAGTYRCTDSFGVKTDQFLEALFCTQAYVELQGKAAGFILLREATDQKLTLGNTSYNLSDYADYVLDACLAVDEYGGIVLRSTSGYCYAIYPHIVEEVFNRSFLFPPKTPQDSTHELTPDTITPEP